MVTALSYEDTETLLSQPATVGAANGRLGAEPAWSDSGASVFPSADLVTLPWMLMDHRVFFPQAQGLHLNLRLLHPVIVAPW